VDTSQQHLNVTAVTQQLPGYQQPDKITLVTPVLAVIVTNDQLPAATATLRELARLTTLEETATTVITPMLLGIWDTQQLITKSIPSVCHVTTTLPSQKEQHMPKEELQRPTVNMSLLGGVTASTVTT